MRIGLLADIHADVDRLKSAIVQLRHERVDRFVVLGDVIYDRKCADETVDLLVECEAIGVWGNHELGLCVEPDDEVREMFSESVMNFFGTLTSHLELGQILFSHSFPDQDAADPYAYYLGRRPEDVGANDVCFSQYPHRIMMIGHFHRWLAVTPSGPLGWLGDKPLCFSREDRYLVMIHSVMNGWAAIADSDQNTLTPIRLPSS